MGEFFTVRRMGYWGLFLALSLLSMFTYLLPLQLRISNLPGPDWTVVIAFAWVLRRPKFVPVLLFAGVIFINDMIYLRAPGLWTAIGIAGLEFLRARARFSRELPFLFEWVLVAGVVLVMTAVNRLVLATLIVVQPDFALDGLQFATTVLVYPAVVAASTILLGVRHPLPGAIDQMGHRL